MWGARKGAGFVRPSGILGQTLALFLATSIARAGDWPQILGPQRNGKAEGERIASSWPSAGPTITWEREVGSGYAGAAVSQGSAILWHRQGSESVAEALDAATGKRRWKVSFPTRYQSSIAPDNGPRCVPLVHENSVYLLGADGDLHALALDSGKTLWSRDTRRDFAAPEGYFGAGSSPILDSGKLLVNVGGRNAGIVAFAPVDGKTVWQVTDEAASYSSPTAATIGGKRHIVFVTRLSVTSVNPADGAVHFQFPFGMRGPTVNAANPLILDEHVFVTSSYGIGARLVRVSGERPKVVWESDDSLSSQFTTPIERDGYLYGIHGRQDGPPASLRCVETKTGKVKWSEDGFGAATLILADDKLLISKINGEIMLVQPSPEGFRRLASAKVFDTTVQALPALASGLLFIRDERTLKSLDLRERFR